MQSLADIVNETSRAIATRTLRKKQAKESNLKAGCLLKSLRLGLNVEHKDFATAQEKVWVGQVESGRAVITAEVARQFIKMMESIHKNKSK